MLIVVKSSGSEITCVDTETTTCPCKCCGFEALPGVVDCPVCGLPLGEEPTEQSKARRDRVRAGEPDWTAYHAEADRVKREARKRERLEVLAEQSRARRAERRVCPDKIARKEPVQGRLF